MPDYASDSQLKLDQLVTFLVKHGIVSQAKIAKILGLSLADFRYDYFKRLFPAPKAPHEP